MNYIELKEHKSDESSNSDIVLLDPSSSSSDESRDMNCVFKNYQITKKVLLDNYDFQISCVAILCIFLLCWIPISLGISDLINAEKTCNITDITTKYGLCENANCFENSCEFDDIYCAQIELTVDWKPDCEKKQQFIVPNRTDIIDKMTSKYISQLQCSYSGIGNICFNPYPEDGGYDMNSRAFLFIFFPFLILFLLLMAVILASYITYVNLKKYDKLSPSDEELK